MMWDFIKRFLEIKMAYVQWFAYVINLEEVVIKGQYVLEAGSFVTETMLWIPN